MAYRTRRSRKEAPPSQPARAGPGHSRPTAFAVASSYFGPYRRIREEVGDVGLVPPRRPRRQQSVDGGEAAQEVGRAVMAGARQRGIDEHDAANLITERIDDRWDEQASIAVWDEDDRIVGGRPGNESSPGRTVRRCALCDSQQVWHPHMPSTALQYAGCRLPGRRREADVIRINDGPIQAACQPCRAGRTHGARTELVAGEPLMTACRVELGVTAAKGTQARSDVRQ